MAHDDVVCPVPQHRDALATEGGHHPHTALAVVDRLPGVDVEHLLDDVALDDVHAGGVRAALEHQQRPGLGHPGDLERRRAPCLLDQHARPDRSRLAGDHQQLDARLGAQVDIELFGSVRHVQRVGRRAHQSRDVLTHEQLNTTLGVQRSSGNGGGTHPLQPVVAGPETDEHAVAEDDGDLVARANTGGVQAAREHV